jgi:L,D-peptidoglycan transpeptidase YkuD (ErfK/YbiS/YcfS/YnhG family)
MSAPRAALVCALAALLPVGACQLSATPTALTAPAGIATLSPSASVTATGPTPSANATTMPPTPGPRTTVVPTRAKATFRPARVGPAPPRLPPPRPQPKPAPPRPQPPGCNVPSGVTARQVVLVDAHGSGATIRACERSGTRYRQVLGPYAGHVGRGGVSAAKREGDLKTPAGVFPVRGGFGVNGNPGLGAGSWLRVDARDVWVDDPRSALYNTHQRLPAGGRWNSAERLQQSPAYSFAQVIGYNEARRPGAGSAIFMHVDQGRGTAGCVSLPTSALLSVMRWERAGVVMAITP